MTAGRAIVLVITAVAAVGFGLCQWFGVGMAWNGTESMPKGLYLSRPAGTVKAGDWVALCVPYSPQSDVFKSRGYLPLDSRCPAGIAPELKPIVASAGDTVEVKPKGIVVNGQAVLDSAIVERDSRGEPIGHLPYGWKKTLGHGEFFALATRVPRSLDSRYYGLVGQADILAKVQPVFLFKE